MPQDDAFDRLIADTLAGPAPGGSSGFEARVLGRVRPRVLTAAGRWALAAYTVMATAAISWAWRDLPPASGATALAACGLIAGAGGAYARRLARGR